MDELDAGGDLALPEQRGFAVGVDVKLRNAAIMEAAAKIGGVPELATHLGVPYGTVSRWSSMAEVPNVTNPKAGRFADVVSRQEIEQKLFVLTGKTLDEIFPQAMQGRHDAMQASETIFLEPSAIARVLNLESSEPSAEERVVLAEVKSAIGKALTTLNHRERDILRLRFGLNGGPCLTLTEVGGMYGITGGRVREIEARAIRKLQDPYRSEPIQKALDG